MLSVFRRRVHHLLRLYRFDAVSTAAEEVKNPQKDLPRGIILSLIICTVLYIAVCAAMTGVVPYPMLDTAAPASFVLEYIGLHLGSAIVGTGAICGLSTVVLACSSLRAGSLLDEP